MVLLYNFSCANSGLIMKNEAHPNLRNAFGGIVFDGWLEVVEKEVVCNHTTEVSSGN